MLWHGRFQVRRTVLHQVLLVSAISLGRREVQRELDQVIFKLWQGLFQVRRTILHAGHTIAATSLGQVISRPSSPSNISSGLELPCLAISSSLFQAPSSSLPLPPRCWLTLVPASRLGLRHFAFPSRPALACFSLPSWYMPTTLADA